jgi:simple sugar transport system ATP-binding protein
LLLLDEPTSALAVRATQALFDYLRLLRDTGLTSILVSHDIFNAHAICDKFIVLSQGRVVLSATRAEATVEDVVRAVSQS